MSHDQVLFVGPDLSNGSASEAFRRQLLALRGPAVADALIDTATGFDGLWLAVRQFLAQASGTLLLVDLDPTADSAYLDWLRSELAQLAGSTEAARRLFVSTPLLGRQPLSAAKACALIEQRDEQLSCDGVAEVAAKPDWSRIPAHRHQLFLCIGARCVRRGALPLWKHVRQRLAAAAAIETADGVLITRTHCQYPCNRGPIATVHPAGHWYQVASLADADRLVDEQLLAHRSAGSILIARQP
ncbi:MULTISPECIES: (2Fe-2S) ferredoxin domain-containing protein [unclassified Pseudomonas]|uniref:(2Fe-2S) ferredoxin domain-containing protein n=1 Tax=unclassified Pseudomonas TaxID=196821 RepID=UPI0024470B2E|nr:MULTISPECIES: (2Fe-2S) ferredoxin domain-containing protein [unclassified Pseudomonas]MDH0301638.1 (2Fe-2S) ferredoxin domain-containing protein [Pseudomonas sp. GD04091]MDH1987252.1 (2Fe-2S) ferredoxin domain-containing protein [Pseudomonas sp. GD03689]